jgi:hypothetical protein
MEALLGQVIYYLLPRTPVMVWEIASPEFQFFGEVFLDTAPRNVI